MHDGNGDLFNFYEVGVNLTIKPDKIDGREVLEILVQPGDYAGEYAYKTRQIKINYNENVASVRPGRHYDTPMHEMGHVLCLNDLDDGFDYGTHKALIGLLLNLLIFDVKI